MHTTSVALFSVHVRVYARRIGREAQPQARVPLVAGGAFVTVSQQPRPQTPLFPRPTAHRDPPSAESCPSLGAFGTRLLSGAKMNSFPIPYGPTHIRSSTTVAPPPPSFCGGS